MHWTTSPSACLNTDAAQQARAHQQQLTKPAGSLGQLETLAIQLAACQGTPHPDIHQPAIVIFAADHGIAAEGVSAFPQAVTVEMIRNFARGGAAISVLARSQNIPLRVINCGTLSPVEPLESVQDARIAPGTANFRHHPAMSEEQLHRALNIGQHTISQLKQQGCDLFIAGEMGIANTTAATALSAALLQQPATHLTGRGTGIDDPTLAHKIAIIDQALAHHASCLTSPLAILQHLGGFEIAAITGAYLAAAQQGIPMLVDGFITSAAALIAVQHNPSVRDWMFFAHASAEPGHQHLMQALHARPLLDLDMRLGEGSGAASALYLLRQACQLHNHMATFQQAGVSGAL